MEATASGDGRIDHNSGLQKLAHELRIGRSLSLGELALALGALSVFAALALAPHFRHGGFYQDDWSNAATALKPPGSPDFGSALGSFADSTLFRPVLVVYVPLTYFVFGMHMHYHLMWAAALAVLAVTMFYGVLRSLGVPWIHALPVAALAIVFPWSDSTRLWVTADQVSLSIAFAAAGILVALVGLNRRSWHWHACALGLYLLSILSYEVTLPLIVCVGVLYLLRAGWRAARWRWLADVAVALVAGIWVGAHTTRTGSGLGGDLEHLGEIVEKGGTILGRAGLPLGGPHTTLVLLAVAAVLGLGAGAYLLLPARFAGKPGWGLRQWLLLAAGGLAVAALGWVMFIPADPYYTPSIYGETNRVNGLAAFGLVVLLYGMFGILGAFIGQLRPKLAWVPVGVTMFLAAALLVSYTDVLRRHIGIWDQAFSAERNALIEMQERMPNLPHGTTVFAGAYPANQAPGVPILSTTWDFNGMVKMEYDDDSLSAYPVLPERSLGCRPGGVTLEREGEREVIAPYGTVRLLDLQSGRQAAPQNRRECLRTAGSYVPGPLYLSLTY